MGLELAEQLGWRLPDAIFYPTGGGVGIIGMWKAFQELEQLGWIGPKRPKMIAVQAAGCAPIVKAFEDGKDSSEFWPNAATVAAGLRVPKALGDFLVLQAVRESGGTCVAVSDQEILRAGRLLAETEGIFAAPEGAACFAAIEPLLAGGFLQADDEIVIWNTGSGLKYLENWRTQFPYQHAASERQGGLILPR
jgi:threonine synthase